MVPTIRPSDKLKFIPYEKRPIKVGDVIVFIPKGTQRKIIHRVVSVDKGRIRTKCNRTMRVDPYNIGVGDVLGQAIAVERRGRWHRIPGGLIGRMCTIRADVILLLKRCAEVFLRPGYLYISRNFALLKYLPKRLVKMKALYFKRQDNFEVQLFFGRLRVAIYHSETNYWKIKAPFKLLANDEILSSLYLSDPDPQASPFLS